MCREVEDHVCSSERDIRRHGKGRQTRPVMKKKLKFISLLKRKQKRSSKIPMYPRGLLQPFPGFILSIVQKSKENTLASSRAKLQRNWERCGLTLQQMPSSLVRRLLSWRESTRRVLLHARLKGNPAWQQ